MDSVSAHGELEIVILHVHSVTEAGITALIENSPKLCLFKIRFTSSLNSQYEQLKSHRHIEKEIFTQKAL